METCFAAVFHGVENPRPARLVGGWGPRAAAGLIVREEGGAALKAFVGEIPGKRTAEEHLGGDISTRGTTAVVAEDAGEFVARAVVYGAYHTGQLEWIKEKRLYNMPVERAADIGIVDEASANVRSVLFLVSGQQGHRDKPSVFRIRRGRARKMTRAELEAQHGYRKGKPEEAGQVYWIWELEGAEGEREGGGKGRSTTGHQDLTSGDGVVQEGA